MTLVMGFLYKNRSIKSSNHKNIILLQRRIVIFIIKELKAFVGSWISVFGVIKFLIKQPQCLPWIIIPLVINVLVMFGSLYLAWLIIISYLPFSWPPIGWDVLLIWEFLKAVISNLLGVIIYMGVFLGIYIVGFSVCCSFFYGIMVEKVERTLGVESNTFNPLSVWRQILDSLLIAFIFLAGNLIILGFNIIPLVGTAFAMFSGVLFQSFCLGMEFFDFSLSLRGQTLKDKFNTFKQYPGEVLGIGNLSWFFMMIPILNSCLFTLSILAATFRVRHRAIYKTQNNLFPERRLKLLTKGSDILPRYYVDSVESNNNLKSSEPMLIYRSESPQAVDIICWISTGEIIDQSKLKLT